MESGKTPSKPTLTLEQIRKIGEEAEKATPGPWELSEDGTGVECLHYEDETPGVCGKHSKNWPMLENDGFFIASSRENVPALCATALAQAARISVLEEALKKISTMCQEYNGTTQYSIGVTDGHRCAAGVARAALQPDEGAGER